MERYVLRGGRWGYDRLQMGAALADLAAFAADPRTVIASPRTFQLWARKAAA